MMKLDELAAIYPEQLWLEFSIEDREQAWARSQEQNYSNASAHWRAFINNLCQSIFCKWLQESSETAPITQVSSNTWEEPQFSNKPSTDSHWQKPNFTWEFVNGTEVTLGEEKLIIVPSDESNLKEFRVPREWVDIPSLAGNYYLAIQLNLEENWLRVWGYTTHQSLRAGKYDISDSTYSINRDDLIEDLAVMFVSQTLYRDRKPMVNPLPKLSDLEAQNLLERLGQPTPYSPRLDLPFAQWAALLENSEWRRELCWRRWRRSQPKPSFPLSQWFQIEQARQVLQTTGWQLAQEVFGQGLAFRHNTHTSRETNVSWVKRIDREINTNIPIALVMNLSYDSEGIISIAPQLQSVNPVAQLPEGIKLTILDRRGTIFTQTQAGRADNLIRTRQFSAAVGESFSIRVEEGESSFIQEFVI